MMASFEECLARVARAGKITEAQALELMQHLSERAERMRQTGKPDPYVAAAGEIADRLEEQAKLDRADALRNAAIRNRTLGEIKSAGSIAQAETILRSLLHGTNIGARDSVEARWRGNAAGWQAALSNKLRKGGVEAAALSGEIDRDVAQELWAIHAGGEAAATGNGPARIIAEAISPMLDYVRDRLNAAGARIGDAKDWVASTLHSPAKIRGAAGPGKTPEEAFAAWWEKTEPLLAEKTFQDLEAEDQGSLFESEEARRRAFGWGVFKGLVTGIHLTDRGPPGVLPPEQGFTPPQFEGTFNVARRLSQSRTLFWRDGAAWNAYVKEFGIPRTITDGVTMALDRGARQLALMEKLGTNPTANLGLVIRRTMEHYQPDVDGVRAFQARIKGMEDVMAHLDGSANMPANQMAAGISASARTWLTMSDLGGVGVTHFASIWPTVTSELAHHGVPRLQAIGNLVAALVKGRGSEERQEVLAQLGAFANGLTRDMHARWQPDEPIPGRLAAMASTYMKWTGIQAVFDRTQAGIREMLANQLGRNVGKGFADLDPHLGQMLGKYGIGPREWNLLRAVPNLPALDGLSYLTPDSARRIDAGAVEAALRARGEIPRDAPPELAAQLVWRYREGLVDKLLSYYGDAAAHGVVTPGVRERAFALGAERPGTIGGELRRFVAQFKMWPLAVLNQVIGREIHMSLSPWYKPGGAVWNLGTLAALSMLGGYVRMAVNSATTGQPMPDPRDPATLTHALAFGGGLGVLGDFLFGEINRMGGGIVSAVAGPVAGDADELVQIFNRFRADTEAKQPHRNGRFSDIWPELARFAVRHVPFANLVYLKGALDYLLWYHLYEAASPGWWERTNRRMIREQGHAMLGYTPGAGVPFVPMGAR